MGVVLELMVDAVDDGPLFGRAESCLVGRALRIEGMTIDPEVVDPEDVEMLQDLVTAAVNEALGKAQELAAQELGAITGGLKIPGM